MKKIISFVMILMLAAALVVPAYAAEATFSVSGATGAPGEQVTVYVSIANNPGILGGNVTLTYDNSVMTLISMTPGFFSTVNPAYSPDAGFANGAYAEPMTENGVLVSAVFVISDSAKNGSTGVSASGTYRDAEGNKISYSSGSSVTVKVPECANHTWGDWTGSEPTCTEDGVKTRTCSVCGKVETETTTKLGHDMKETAAAIAPTCTADGKTAVQTCSRCGTSTGGDVVPKVDHKMKQTAAEVPATCMKEGKTAVLSCEFNCGTTEGGAVIPKLDHKMKQTAAEIPATCTAEGKTAVFSCEYNCGTTEGGAVIPKLDHKLEDVAEKLPTNCGETGTKAHKKCSVCGKTFIDGKEVKAEDLEITLKHDLKDVAEDPATCDKAGTKAHKKCSACGKTFIDGKEVKAEDLVIPSLHDQLKWKSDANKHWKECKDHGRINEGAHKYSNGYCTVCGYQKPGSNPNLDGQPSTGDIFVEIAVYASLAALAVGAVVFAKRKARG